MKCFILFLFVTFPLRLFCQGGHEIVLDSTITDIWYLYIDEHHRSRHIYTYDSLSNLIEHYEYADYEKNTNIWSPESLQVNTYDSEGHPTEKADYYGWKNNKWEEGHRIVYSYDSIGNLLVETWLGFFYSGANDWEAESRTEYAYDTNGNLEEEIFYGWNSETGDWVGRVRNVYAYDASGNRTELIEYDWDSEHNDWIGSNRDVYAYNSNGVLSEHDHYRWDAVSKQWFPSGIFCFHGMCWCDKIEYLYDEEGNISEEASFDWDSASADWLKVESRVYVYDGGGNLREKTQSNRTWWDPDSSSMDLKGTSHEVYSYDVNGNQTEHIYHYWNSDINDWREEDRYVYSYDVSGNQTEQIYYNWNSDINDWRGEERIVYSYDFSGYLTEKLIFHWMRDTGWVMAGKDSFYWSSQLLGYKAFYVDENCMDCTSLGTLVTGGMYPRETISFRMIEADDDHIFDLDTTTGEILIMNSSYLDYESHSSYQLTIQAQCAYGGGLLMDTVVIDVFVNNVNDNAPILHDTAFYLDENTKIWNPVGQVVGTDADMDPLSYSITAGNDDSAFYINGVTGKIITNTKDIDYETQDYYAFTVQVSDGIFADEAIVAIYINDIDETSTGIINFEHFIRIYPNPVHDVLFIDVPEDYKNGFELEMISLSGRVVFQKSGYIEQLDLASFQEGIYFITFRSQDFVTTRKVVKL